MSIGERLVILRTQRKMSQSDLAEALDVSRQSISKWETDSSVPELDKLVALCDIFGVSMDMLVRGVEGETGKDKEAAPEKPETDCADREIPQEVVHIVKLETRKIIGILLFICAMVCVGAGVFLGDPAAGFLLGLPFIICTVICLVCRKRTGLWCAWTVYLYAQVFMRFATGISTGFVWAFLRGYVGLDVNVIASFIALILTICLAAGTVWSFRKDDIRPRKNSNVWLVAGWAAYVVLRFTMGKVVGLLLARTGMWAISIIYILFTDWFLFAFLVLLLIWTYHWWKEVRASKAKNTEE